MTMPSEKGDPASQRRENILFYTTAFFVLLAMFSLFAFLFLVPFFIEPALATLYMDFDPTPVTCETVEANFLRGLSNCNWSSCREGCTKEVFECWHIRVRYASPVPPPVSAIPASESLSTSSSASSAVPMDHDLKSLHYNAKLPGQSQASDRLQSVLPGPDETDPVLGRLLADEPVKLYEHRARLQPNVKGCGYPPDVECNNSFAPTYGVVGNNFSCFYSTVDPTLAITHLNIEQVRAELIYCLTIPVFLFIVSVIYLFYAYFKIYAEDAPTAAADSTAGSGLVSASASAHASASLAGRSPSNFGCSQPGRSRSDLAVEDVVIERPTSPSGSMAGKFRDFDDPQSPYDPHHRHRGQRVVRRAKSGGTIGSPLATSSTARGQAGVSRSRADYGTSKSPAGTSGGMRLSKSMGPRVGECCVAATAERRPACSYLSRSSSTCSTTSSASSSSSSTCSSSRSSSTSSSSSVTSSAPSSPSHVPESLSSSRSSLASGASGHSDDMALTSAASAAAQGSSAAAEPIAMTINDQAAAQQLNQPSPTAARRRPRECVPLISKN